MLRTILAGLDGTPDSQAVLTLGIQWARRTGALLVGLAIIDEPGLHGPEEWVLGETPFMHRRNQELLNVLSRKSDQVLDAAAARCAQEGVAFKPIEDVGDPFDQIRSEAHRYDLIMLGRETHFQFGFEKMADDVLTCILRVTPRPVVVVPRTLGPGEAVIVAFDGSLEASHALCAFAASGLGLGRDVHVVSIAPERQVAADHAARAVEFLTFHEIKAVPAAIVSSEAPAATLLRLSPGPRSGPDRDGRIRPADAAGVPGGLDNPDDVARDLRSLVRLALSRGRFEGWSEWKTSALGPRARFSSKLVWEHHIPHRSTLSSPDWRPMPSVDWMASRQPSGSIAMGPIN